MIRRCDKCVNSGSRAAAFQDRRYGKGNRVHNSGPFANGGYKLRCTVCGNEKNESSRK